MQQKLSITNQQHRIVWVDVLRFIAIFMVICVYMFYTPEVYGVSSWNPFNTFYYFAGFNGYLIPGYVLRNDIKKLSIGKTLTISTPLFAVGYIATYAGFRYMTSIPGSTEEQAELFFLYCSFNVMTMTVAVFLLIRCIRLSSPILLKAFADITKCGLGIYLLHYFIVGFGYWIADVLDIPVFIKIPVTAIIVFLICWGIVSSFFKLLPKSSKWIFG